MMPGISVTAFCRSCDIIDKEHLEDFRQHEVILVKIDMGEEGQRIYYFKLHKAAIMEQLDCLIKRKYE